MKPFSPRALPASAPRRRPEHGAGPGDAGINPSHRSHDQAAWSGRAWGLGLSGPGPWCPVLGVADNQRDIRRHPRHPSYFVTLRNAPTSPVDASRFMPPAQPPGSSEFSRAWRKHDPSMASERFSEVPLELAPTGRAYPGSQTHRDPTTYLCVHEVKVRSLRTGAGFPATSSGGAPPDGGPARPLAWPHPGPADGAQGVGRRPAGVVPVPVEPGGRDGQRRRGGRSRDGPHGSPDIDRGGRALRARQAIVLKWWVSPLGDRLPTRARGQDEHLGGSLSAGPQSPGCFT